MNLWARLTDFPSVHNHCGFAVLFLLRHGCFYSDGSRPTREPTPFTRTWDQHVYVGKGRIGAHFDKLYLYLIIQTFKIILANLQKLCYFFLTSVLKFLRLLMLYSMSVLPSVIKSDLCCIFPTLCSLYLYRFTVQNCICSLTDENTISR